MSDKEMESDGDFIPVLSRKRRKGISSSGDESDSSVKTVTERNAVRNVAPAQRSERIPPIVVAPSAVDSTWPVFLMSLRDETVDFDAKFQGDKLHVMCFNVDAFRKLQRVLSSRKVHFHTFTLREEAELTATLRGVHHSTDPAMIADELKRRGFEASFVKALPRRSNGSSQPTNTFLLKVKKTGRWEDLWKVDHLLGVRVTIDPFEHGDSVPQCYRCQRFGHSSRNCNLPSRCVKCAGDHEARDCRRAREDAAKCCNCGGPHVASWRGCKAHQDAVKAKLRREAQSRVPSKTRATGPAPRAPAKPLPPAGLKKGSFASVAGAATTSQPKGASEAKTPSVTPEMPPPPPPVAPSTRTAEATAPVVNKKQRNRRQRKSQRPQPQRSLSFSGVDGDDSETETDTNCQGKEKAARPKPQKPRGSPIVPASPMCFQFTGQQRQEESDQHQGLKKTITVNDLVVWITKVVPILVSAKERSPAELLAELMSGLLELLQ
jgi:hypothetical protein